MKRLFLFVVVTLALSVSPWVALAEETENTSKPRAQITTTMDSETVQFSVELSDFPSDSRLFRTISFTQAECFFAPPVVSEVSSDEVGTTDENGSFLDEVSFDGCTGRFTVQYVDLNESQFAIATVIFDRTDYVERTARSPFLIGEPGF